MSAHEMSEASLLRVVPLAASQGGVALPASMPHLPQASPDGVAAQRFAAVMTAATAPAIAPSSAPAGMPGSSPGELSSLFRVAAARHVTQDRRLAVAPAGPALKPAAVGVGADTRLVAQRAASAPAPGKNAGQVTQRFIDTMNAAQALDRAGDAKAAAPMGAGPAGPDRVAGTGAVKSGLSALLGKISAMHADLDRRATDPASYANAAGMIGLQRMTGMYTLYFETFVKSVFKVLRDADTFMKSSA